MTSMKHHTPHQSITPQELAGIVDFPGYIGQGFDVAKEGCYVVCIPIDLSSREIPIENTYLPWSNTDGRCWAWVPFKNARAYLRTTGFTYFPGYWYWYTGGKWTGPYKPTEDIVTDIDFIF